MESVNKERFDELLKGDKPVVCDFFATWCGPCRMLAPVLEEMSKKFADKAVFVKVDVDENFELAARYGISSIPVIGVFKDGKIADRSVGFTSNSETEEFLNGNL